MSEAVKGIRIRTYYRGGSGTRLVEDRVVRPLTTDERRSGMRDEFGEFVATHGLPGARRKHSRRIAYVPERGCCTDTSLNLKLDEDGMPSKEDQEAVYKMMRPHIYLVARNLVGSGCIAAADQKDAEIALFEVCRDSMPKWNPVKAGLKTFLYECIASAVVNFIEERKCGKRGFSYIHCGIVNSLDDATDGDDLKDAASDVISIEAIPDRDAYRKLEFLWAFDDLVDLLDADERLALDYLFRDYSQEFVASCLGCSLMRFRRYVLQSLQNKAVLCGFEPKNGTFV